MIPGILVLSIAVASASQADGQPPPRTEPATQITTTQPASPTVELDEHARLITENNTPEARQLGARKLLETATPAAISRLVAILENSGDLAARKAICLAMSKGGHTPAALAEPVMNLLGDESDELEQAALLALSAYGSPAIPRLRSIAVDSKAPIKQREAAIQALGMLRGGLPVVRVLVELLRVDPLVRGAALDALARTTGQRHADANAALGWWESHAGMSDQAWLAELNERRLAQIDRLRSEKASLSARLVAAYHEAYIQTPEGDDRVTKVLAFLKDDLPDIRRLGLGILNGWITDRKEVVEPIRVRLAEMIPDPNPAVRREIARMAADLRLEGATQRICETLASETDHGVRTEHVRALGRLDNPEAIPALVSRLDDEVDNVVTEAATSISLIMRRGRPNGANRDQATEVLLERISRIDPSQTGMRVKFLEAMGRIGDTAFRPILKTHLAINHAIDVRCAAATALGNYADAEAADLIRPLLTADEVALRLAATEALGQCGRRDEDVIALHERLDPANESSQAVQDSARDSLLDIAGTLLPARRIAVAERFASAKDMRTRRLRLDILKPMRDREEDYKRLSEADRLALLAALSDAQLSLDQHAAAIETIDSHLALLGNKDDESRDSLISRSLFARLRVGGRDADAMAWLQRFGLGDAVNGKPVETPLRIELVLEEIRHRQEQASDARAFDSLIGLIELAQPVLVELDARADQQLADLRREAAAKQLDEINRLLNEIEKPESSIKLMAYRGELVLPEVVDRLSGSLATSAPANEKEGALIALAAKIAPGWSPIGPESSADERIKALQALKKIAQGKPAQTTTSTAPAE